MKLNLVNLLVRFKTVTIKNIVLEITTIITKVTMTFCLPNGLLNISVYESDI